MDASETADRARNLPTGMFYVRREFDDFDDLADFTRHWDLDLLQLDRGSFRGRMLQVGSPRVLVCRAAFDRTLLQRGAAPPGYRTFGIPAREGTSFQWRGHPVRGDTLTCFPASRELLAHSPPGFFVYTVSIEEEHLAAVAAADSLPDLGDLLGRAEAMRCDRAQLDCIRLCLEDAIAACDSERDALEDQELRHALEHDIPRRILGLLATRQGLAAAVRPSTRADLARAVTQHLDDVRGPASRVDRLAAEMGVSQPTLRRAFREHLCASPKRYLHALRLRGTRRDLRRPDSATALVKATALRWGFRHMGQFSADYKAWFGELPSETLLRSRTEEQ